MADLSIDCSEYFKRVGRSQIAAVGGEGNRPANANLFWSGWDGVANGASATSVKDDGVWDECVPSDPSADPPPRIEVVSDVTYHVGGKSLKHSYLEGDIGDGGGYETIVLADPFSALGSEHYGMYRVYYSAGFYWVADLKHIIMGASGQDFYIETRPYYTWPGGVGPDHDSGRLKVSLMTGGDTIYESANVRFYPGQWYDVEWHMVNGGSGTGSLVMRVDGTIVQWTTENGGDPVECSTDDAYTFFKWSTYCNSSGDSGFQAACPFYQYMDDISIGNLGWIRGT